MESIDQSKQTQSRNLIPPNDISDEALEREIDMISIGQELSDLSDDNEVEEKVKAKITEISKAGYNIKSVEFKVEPKTPAETQPTRAPRSSLLGPPAGKGRRKRGSRKVKTEIGSPTTAKSNHEVRTTNDSSMKVPDTNQKFSNNSSVPINNKSKGTTKIQSEVHVLPKNTSAPTKDASMGNLKIQSVVQKIPEHPSVPINNKLRAAHKNQSKAIPSTSTKVDLPGKSGNHCKIETNTVANEETVILEKLKKMAESASFRNRIKSSKNVESASDMKSIGQTSQDSRGNTKRPLSKNNSPENFPKRIKTFAEVLSDDLILFISDRDNVIDDDKAGKLEKSMMEEFFKFVSTNPKTAPTYHHSSVRFGTLRMMCSDKFSADWFTKTIRDMPPPWIGANLEVVSAATRKQKIAARKPSIRFFIPNGMTKQSFESVKNIIKIQNPPLNTDDWETWKEVEREAGMFYHVSVKNEDIGTIAEKGSRLFFCFNKIRIYLPRQPNSDVSESNEDEEAEVN